MISRLTASATAFAIFVTASLAVAAGPTKHAEAPEAAASRAKPQVIQLERVVVTGKRSSAMPR